MLSVFQVRWCIYIFSVVGIYTHRVGSICSTSGGYRFITRVKVDGTWTQGCLPVGWNLSGRGLNRTEPLSWWNRGSVLMKCKLRFAKTEPLLQVDIASKEELKLYTFAFRFAFRQNLRWKGAFLKNWKLKAFCSFTI